MRLVKTVLFLMVLLVLLTSCAREGGFAGRAFYAGLGQAGYAEPTTFSIDKNSYKEGEILSAGVTEEFVYKFGYITDSSGQWKKFEYAGTPIGASNWLRTSASKQLLLTKQDLADGGNFIIAYACTRTQTGFDCHNNRWMIHSFTFTSPPQLWPETAYHVDGSYTGTGDGSKQKPWKTISEAAAFSLQPGDFVVVHPGTYRESVRLNHKGTKEAPITFLADGEVVIKGSEPIVSWEQDVSKKGCYVHPKWIYKEPFPVPASDVDYILYETLKKTVNGQEKDYTQYYKDLEVTVKWEPNPSKVGYDPSYDIIITNWDKGTEFFRKEFPDIFYSLSRNQVFVDEKPLREAVTKEALKGGTFYIEPSTKELLVCLADSSNPASNPATHTMEGSTRDGLVRFHKDSSWIVFKGFKLRHSSSPIAANPWISENAVELAGTNHVFENNEIKYVNGQGLTVVGHPNQPSPIVPNYDYAEQDNYGELMQKTHLGHLIKGNIIEHSGFNGVTGNLANGVKFYDNTVRFNSLRTRFLFPGWAAGAIKLASCQNWDIQGLKAAYNYYHALWFDTACFGHKIRNNVFYGNYAAVRLEACNAKTPEQGNLIDNNIIYSNVEGVDWTGGAYITVSNNLIAYNDIGIATVGGTVSPGQTNKVSGNLITDQEVTNVGYSIHTPDILFDNNLYYGVIECHYPTPDCSQLSYWARQEALEKDIDNQDLSAEEKAALKTQLRYVHGKPNWNAHLALRQASYMKTLAEWQQATDVWSKDAAFTYYDYKNAAQAAANWNNYYKGTYPSADGNGNENVLLPQYLTGKYLQIPLKQDQNSVYADPKYKDPINANFCLAEDSPARQKNGLVSMDIGPAALYKC